MINGLIFIQHFIKKKKLYLSTQRALYNTYHSQQHPTPTQKKKYTHQQFVDSHLGKPLLHLRCRTISDHFHPQRSPDCCLHSCSSPWLHWGHRSRSPLLDLACLYWCSHLSENKKHMITLQWRSFHSAKACPGMFSPPNIPSAQSLSLISQQIRGAPTRPVLMSSTVK